MAINPTSGGGAAAIADAQSQSALRDRQNAEVAAANAESFRALEDKGIKVFTCDFVQIYKDQMRAAVDTDGNGVISEAELASKAQAGGASKEQADALYKAMDMDGDGVVSAGEFENSLPVSTEAFIRQRETLFRASRQGADVDVLHPSAIVAGMVKPTETLGQLASGFSDQS